MVEIEYIMVPHHTYTQNAILCFINANWTLQTFLYMQLCFPRSLVAQMINASPPSLPTLLLTSQVKWWKWWLSNLLQKLTIRYPFRIPWFSSYTVTHSFPLTAPVVRNLLSRSSGCKNYNYPFLRPRRHNHSGNWGIEYYTGKRHVEWGCTQQVR